MRTAAELLCEGMLETQSHTFSLYRRLETHIFTLYKKTHFLLLVSYTLNMTKVVLLLGQLGLIK